MASSIHIPSEILTLPRHETFAHERFAYVMLRIAALSLGQFEWSSDIALHFGVRDGVQAWSFDVAIAEQKAIDGSHTGFQVWCTPMSPALVMGICHHFSPGLFDPEQLGAWRENPSLFRDHVEEFGAAYADTIRDHTSGGVAGVLSQFYSAIGLDMANMADHADDFDLCAQFIANHEVAHAYTNQVTMPIGHLSTNDERAFEHVSDLLATEWQYNRMVLGTPSTAEYLTHIGMDTQTEAILDNVWRVYRGQMLVFLVFAIASAISGDGTVNLDGGRSHPHGMMRWLSQQAHFVTLVLSNQHSHVSETQIAEFDVYWEHWMILFLTSGLFSKDDMLAVTREQHQEDLRRAAALIKKYHIRELERVGAAIEGLILPILTCGST